MVQNVSNSVRSMTPSPSPSVPPMRNALPRIGNSFLEYVHDEFTASVVPSSLLTGGVQPLQSVGVVFVEMIEAPLESTQTSMSLSL